MDENLLAMSNALQRKSEKITRKSRVEQAYVDAWKDMRQAEEKKDVNIVSDVMKKAQNKEVKVASKAKLDTQPVNLESVQN